MECFVKSNFLSNASLTLNCLISDREKVCDLFCFGDHHSCGSFWAFFRRSSCFLAILADKVGTGKKPSLIFNQVKE